MKKIVWTLVFVLGSTSILYAPPPQGIFHNEPAEHWPDQWQLPTGEWITNTWVTSFPYQRNILYNFDNQLNPWQATCYGTDDASLSGSDVVYPGAAFVWYDNDAAFQPGGVPARYGLVGIDNRQGTDNVISGLTFVIDNWDSPRDWKHVWMEIVYYAGPGFDQERQITAPDNFTTIEQVVFNNDLYDNWVLVDFAYKVYPNPPWEQITIIVRVPPGSFILADEIHFATECVPEPATVTLALIGAGSILALRRRRRRR